MQFQGIGLRDGVLQFIQLWLNCCDCAVFCQEVQRESAKSCCKTGKFVTGMEAMSGHDHCGFSFHHMF